MTMPFRPHSPKPTRDERGSMIVSVGVMMVLTLLSAAVVTRTIAGMQSTRQGQDFSAALAAADAGVSDALFRIDQLGKAVASDFCVGPHPNCTVAAVPGAPGVEYTAHRVDANTFRIRSKGTVNGQPHAVEALVARAYDYPYAIFTRVALTFNGNTGNYDPITGVGPVRTVDANNNTVLEPRPIVASNGQISCHGSDSPAAGQKYFRGGGTNCANGELQSGTYNPKDPVSSCPAPVNVPTTPCLPAGSSACPTTDGMLPGSLLPGVYLCTEDDLGSGTTLRFPEVFTVASGTANSGNVEIFVIPTDSTRITLSIAGASVNQNGDPSRLRVYLAGGRINPGNGSNSGVFTGILYAPSADETNPSCGADWRGAVVTQTFTCNGGPHLDVRYDDRIRSVVSSSWTVTNYTEIPSEQVTLP